MTNLKSKLLFGIVPILAVVMLTAFSCSTGEPPEPPPPPEKVNVILYDKDTTTIESYIQGKWQLLYTFGGFASYRQDCDNCFVEFIPEDKKYNKWPYVWELDVFYQDTYVMIINDGLKFLFDGIYNDTLRYVDAYVTEPFAYYCVKVNN
jgi:hypothetical protein